MGAEPVGVGAASGYNLSMTRQLEAIYEAGVLRPLEPLPFADHQHVIVTVTDEAPDSSVVNHRGQELEWVRTHRDEYAGQWLALDGDQLIAAGSNAGAVLEEARSKGVLRPFLVHVPELDDVPFGGW